MRCVVQRVTQCRVTVGSEVVGEIGGGLLVLLGVEQGDEPRDTKYLVEKIAGLRIFEDGAGRMNLNVAEAGGSALVVSQFTLLGDVRRGLRPSFTSAAEPQRANQLYEDFCELLGATGLTVARGRFQADMQVMLINDGPVTILLDSRKLF
ncbi:MAG: D-aminoacyl-tRNA deacylase [Pirellulaceae bacterium]